MHEKFGESGESHTLNKEQRKGERLDMLKVAILSERNPTKKKDMQEEIEKLEEILLK